jgi:arylsulfatase A-like enzyme
MWPAPGTVDGRIRRRTALGGALALSAVAWRGGAAAGATPSRPNIVWFRSEDHHSEYVGAYGNPVARTPTIDRLAREGVRYRNFFSTNPVCAPSKLATLTGLHAESQGPGHNMRATANSPSWVVGFATYLQRAGYWTSEQGTPSANPDYNSALTATGYHDTSGDWRKRPNASMPFFALLGSMTTHETQSFLPIPGATDAADVRIPRYHPDNAIMRRDKAHYMDQMTTMDGELAKVIERLKADGLWDNTILIYSSDHGGVMPRSKRYCYDSGMRAPLIIRFPRRWRHLAPAGKGGVVADPATSIDLPPTILGFAGVKSPGYFHGQAVAGPRREPRRYAFGARQRMDEQMDFVRTVRSGRYRYIRNYLPHLDYAQHNYFMWLQAGVREWERAFLAGELDEVQSRFFRPKPPEELYDLKKDPDEVTNLARTEKHRKRLRRMSKALDQHMLRIHDNGFAAEGMSCEGWHQSRKAGVYPLERLLKLGRLASRGDARHLAELVDALADHAEVVRYWGAMGLSILGPKARPALPALRRAMASDPSAWVRAQAADAVARAGAPAEALPVLIALAAPGNKTSVQLQTIWSLARLEGAAVSAVPMLTAVAVSGNPTAPPQAAARFALRKVTRTYVPAP